MKKVADELTKLLDLKEKGALTQQEFDRLKAKLLDLKTMQNGGIRSNISVKKVKSAIEMFFRNRPRLHAEFLGPVPTFRKNEIPPHIQNNLDKYAEHAKSSCPECGYIGKVGYEGKMVPWFIRAVPCFCLYLLITGFAIFITKTYIYTSSNTPLPMSSGMVVMVFMFGIPFGFVYLIYDFFRKELVKCPNCEKSHFLPRTYFN